MQALKRGIKMNEKLQAAEKYSKQLEGIARITNWHESKLKNQKAKELLAQKSSMEEYMKSAGQQLKIRRRTRLEIQYKEDNERYQQQLKAMGLAVYKTKI